MIIIYKILNITHYLEIKLMIIVYKTLNITHTKYIQIKKLTQFKS